MPFIERLSDPRHPEVENYENAFDFPELDDQFLWRYLSIEQYLSLLLNSSLYFSRADRFADEFEGTLPEATDLDPVFKDLYQQFKKLIHLNCWNVNRVESILMWDSYAPRGVVIKTTLGDLINSLDAEDDFTIHVCEVEYINFTNSNINLVDRTDGSRRGNTLDLFQYKREYYSGEREIRLITNTQAAYSRRDVLEGQRQSIDEWAQYEEEEIRIDIDLDFLLGEVIVHPEADQNTVKALKAITDRIHGLGNRLSRSQIEGEPSF